MPAISRKVGTTSEYLPVFIPDSTVSTGAGLANIVVSTMSLSWYRSDMVAISTQTCSSGTFGTWATSTVNQGSSTLALGWYGVSLPNGMFASGRSAFAHLYGAANMAPVPILVELEAWDNQSAISTQASTMPVNMTAILGSSPLTTAAGVQAYAFDLGRTINTASTVAMPGLSISTNQLVNVNQILGSTPVTTAAGVQAYAWDLGRTANLTSTIALPGTTLSTEQLVNINQIFGSPAITTSAGILSAGNAFLDASISSRFAAASYTAPDNTGISFISSTAQTLTAAERNSVADALLNRNVSGGSSSGRTVKQAYHLLRNKVDTGVGIVYDTDDTTSSWGFTVSTQAGNPIVAVDPT